MTSIGACEDPTPTHWAFKTCQVEASAGLWTVRLIVKSLRSWITSVKYLLITGCLFNHICNISAFIKKMWYLHVVKYGIVIIDTLRSLIIFQMGAADRAWTRSTTQQGSPAEWWLITYLVQQILHGQGAPPSGVLQQNGGAVPADPLLGFGPTQLHIHELAHRGDAIFHWCCCLPWWLDPNVTHGMALNNGAFKTVSFYLQNKYNIPKIWYVSSETV